MNMLNYILIGLGAIFLLVSLLFFIMGLNPKEDTSIGGQIGYFIGSLILSVPTFIIGVVLLSVGLLRKK